jgi:hypothetical protein
MQRELPMLGVIEAPKPVARSVISAIKTYRQAVRVAWKLRRAQGMTKQQLACFAGLYAPHITDYLHEDDRPSRRDLPAAKVTDFEDVVGNRVVSQWLAAQSNLTVLEGFQAEERIAA